MHDTVDVLTSESGTRALGSAFGSREHINAREWESVRACDEMRSAIGSVDHAPTEMVLARQCADVSKVTYHMRINGDLIDQDLLVAHDGQLGASVSASLSGDLDRSWWQTTIGVTCGGLSPVAPCAAPSCPPWLTTSASPVASRTSPSWQGMTRAPTQPSGALFRRFR